MWSSSWSLCRAPESEKPVSTFLGALVSVEGHKKTASNVRAVGFGFGRIVSGSDQARGSLRRERIAKIPKREGGDGTDHNGCVAWHLRDVDSDFWASRNAALVRFSNRAVVARRLPRGRLVKSEAIASPPSRDLSWVGIVLAIIADQRARFPRTQQERPPIPGSLHARHSS